MIFSAIDDPAVDGHISSFLGAMVDGETTTLHCLPPILRVILKLVREIRSTKVPRHIQEDGVDQEYFQSIDLF